MAQKINVLIMVHGMVPEQVPISMTEQYKEFWKNLCRYQPNLDSLIDDKIYVEWGHDIPGRKRDIRDDEKLTEAERYIGSQVDYNVIKKNPSDKNKLLHNFRFPYFSGQIIGIREGIVLNGFADVLYYCSEDGEKRVRNVVYEAILGKLEKYSGDDEIRLHFFGHSLGVTIIHDFLFGLFNENHPNPDFLKQSENSEDADKYMKWKKKAEEGILKLGSFSAAASQLPIFVMRKQVMIDIFYNNKLLNPEVIGIKNNVGIKWQIFWDKHDIIGFPTSPMYYPNDAIKDIEVKAGCIPPKTHTGYWTNETVIKETADLIYKNTQ